jgi:YegS/Rv2252/BmrU family lipid kinase
MPLKKIFILYNANARTINLDQLKKTHSFLSSKLPTELIQTHSPEEAIKRAQELGQDPDHLIVPCGGDGTINTVLNGLPQNSTMGILPAGTANVIARELGIPLNIIEAAKLLLTGATKTIDLGEFNGQKFVFVAGIGFDATVADSVSSPLKKIIGKLAYHIETGKQFPFYVPPEISITIDNNVEVKGKYAIIANMRRYGGDLFFARNAKYDDGLLDLVLFEEWNLNLLLHSFNCARKNIPTSKPQIKHFTGKEFIIKINPSAKYQLDGETFSEETQATIRVLPESQRVVIP